MNSKRTFAGFIALVAVWGIGGLFSIGSHGALRLAAETQTQARTAQSHPSQTRADTTARAQPPTKEPTTFGLGRPATPAEIAAWDIDVRPDGKGLPPGHGTSADGERVYAARCVACHGKTGKEGPNDKLVGREPRDGFPFGRDPTLTKTIGNYWPYATTIFDYVRRAMPSDAPGSLSDNESYGLVAYLLYLNELIPADAVMDATSLPKVVMPARDRFVPDPRGGPKSVPRPQGSAGRRQLIVR